MEILTVVLIGALVLGSFMLFQDYYEKPPMGQFSFSYLFYIGIITIVGTAIAFGIISYRKKQSKSV
jgi:membrane-associated protease RseP (regulator of RpoE activity)